MASLYHYHSASSSTENLIRVNTTSTASSTHYATHRRSSSSSSSSASYDYERFGPVPNDLYEYEVPVVSRQSSLLDHELAYVDNTSGNATTLRWLMSVNGEACPPPAYAEVPSSAPSSVEPAKSDRSVFSLIFSRLRRKASAQSNAAAAPPTYRINEEIAIMQARLRQIDRLFGDDAP
ncbi:hypothetical protein DL93DRAFT_2076221 [Clavulina sp. PMI_390]|nr:hypothetical protein DL93DRAFT_2076221 [Clavulina sp. PMI_390]